jgi:phosphomannomutase
VRSPNPEDPGALVRVLALADEEHADVVLANDTDADRLAVAVRHEDRLVRLSGNEIGALLGEHVLATGALAPRRVVLSSIVSSPFLGVIAAAHGARWEPTLTGHKWIHHRAIALEAAGYAFVYGYEEALGYAVSPRVRDKDGIASAVAVADMAAMHRREGRTLVDALGLLHARHGVFVDRSHAFALGEGERRRAIEDAVAGCFEAPPSTVAGVRVIEAIDHRHRSGGLPPAELLELRLEDDHRVMLRPSGTEPKLKIYVDVRLAADELARERGERLASVMLDELAFSLGLSR